MDLDELERLALAANEGQRRGESLWDATDRRARAFSALYEVADPQAILELIALARRKEG